jgi:phosphoglucosamine mutase
MNKKLFGTDGIRGRAGQYPITPEVISQLGRSIVRSLKSNSRQTKIIIGKDTRISCDMIESAIAEGICSMGGDAYLAGVLPTPGIAFLVAYDKFDSGVMISASHNPYYDNGVKIFNSSGFKLSDSMEAEIENFMIKNGQSMANQVLEDPIGSVRQAGSAETKYIEFLKQILPDGYSFQGIKIVMDCANGATYRIAPRLFHELDAQLNVFFADPNGKNINDHCGSQYTESIQKFVLETKADIGLAFDGDGDRLIAIDEYGKVVTGDQILSVCAKFIKEHRILKNNVVVSTVMSNFGLRQALKEMNIRHVMADVGDRYVLEQMIAHNAILGGEDSGHMIFLNDHTSGDGILTAIRLIQIMKESQKPLSELAKIMRIYPQILMNVEVKNKIDIQNVPEIIDVIKDVENRLKDQGRVLVRYSGTQPLCRVMVEGPSEADTHRYCHQIAEIISEKLNIKN